MEPLSKRKRKTYLIIFFIVFILFIPAIIFYAIGYRITLTEGIIQTGGIFINIEESDTEVFINNKLVKRPGLFRRNYFIQDLTPGIFSIAVTKKNYQTWQKTVKVLPALVAEANPFLFPTTLNSRKILPFFLPANEESGEAATTTATSSPHTIPNLEFTAVRSLFSTTTTFTTRIKPAELRATTTLQKTFHNLATTTEEKQNRNITIYKDKNKLYAAWLGNLNEAPFFFCSDLICNDTIIFYTVKKSIAHFDFYPGRNDLVIVASADGVFVVELDSRPEQNIQFLYETPGSTFRVGQGGVIYINDKTNYFAVEL